MTIKEVVKNYSFVEFAAMMQGQSNWDEFTSRKVYDHFDVKKDKKKAKKAKRKQV